MGLNDDCGPFFWPFSIGTHHDALLLASVRVRQDRLQWRVQKTMALLDATANAIAGVIGGVSAHIMFWPLEKIRTEMQAAGKRQTPTGGSVPVSAVASALTASASSTPAPAPATLTRNASVQPTEMTFGRTLSVTSSSSVSEAPATVVDAPPESTFALVQRLIRTHGWQELYRGFQSGLYGTKQ
jgi:hypothetical protein